MPHPQATCLDYPTARPFPAPYLRTRLHTLRFSCRTIPHSPLRISTYSHTIPGPTPPPTFCLCHPQPIYIPWSVLHSGCSHSHNRGLVIFRYGVAMLPDTICRLLGMSHLIIWLLHSIQLVPGFLCMGKNCRIQHLYFNMGLLIDLAKVSLQYSS